MFDLTRTLPQGAYVRAIAKETLPRTARELERWHARIAAIPNRELQRQAWASVTRKRFHAEGGGVYAALAPERAADLVPLIVALQTISDYLDNLCDRSVSMDEADFRALHRALLDAVDADSSAPPTDYYALHPNKDDGGYLQALVDECRRRVATLPSYHVAAPRVRRLVGLYNDLQVYKHGPLPGRVPTLEAWFRDADLSPFGDGAGELAKWTSASSAGHVEKPAKEDEEGLYWWEFAAAAGSTLAMFALFAAASRPNLTPEAADRIVRAYFPWICGLHILLDYLIDQEEDARGGDLNFVAYYPDEAERRRRLIAFVAQARRRAAGLPDAAFHTTVVQGLPGLYLSDDKVRRQRLQPLARRLLRAAGPASFGYYAWCLWRRRFDPRARPDGRPAPCDRDGFPPRT